MNRKPLPLCHETGLLCHECDVDVTNKMTKKSMQNSDGINKIKLVPVGVVYNTKKKKK